LKNLYALPNEEIVNGFISGNQTHFGLIYDVVSTPLFNIILCRVKNIETAERLLEAAFVTAWKSRSEYDPANETINKWLYKICIQSCNGYLLDKTNFCQLLCNVK
jgi:DNA-directed RNA polymerase specialized sigma24 family protein